MLYYYCEHTSCHNYNTADYIRRIFIHKVVKVLMRRRSDQLSPPGEPEPDRQTGSRSGYRQVLLQSLVLLPHRSEISLCVHCCVLSKHTLTQTRAHTNMRARTHSLLFSFLSLIKSQDGGWSLVSHCLIILLLPVVWFCLHGSLVVCSLLSGGQIMLRMIHLSVNRKSLFIFSNNLHFFSD